jgi:hypothetical protein
LVIAYEDALAEIELANSFSAANAGPPTSPPEARQMPGTVVNCATDGATSVIATPKMVLLNASNRRISKRPICFNLAPAARIDAP